MRGCPQWALTSRFPCIYSFSRAKILGVKVTNANAKVRAEEA